MAPFSGEIKLVFMINCINVSMSIIIDLSSEDKSRCNKTILRSTVKWVHFILIIIFKWIFSRSTLCVSDQSCRKLKSVCLYLVQTLRLYIDRSDLQRGCVEGGAGVTGTRTFWGTDSEQMESEIWCLQTSMQAVDRSNPEHRSGERLESHQSNDNMLVISNKPDSADSRSHMQPYICSVIYPLNFMLLISVFTLRLRHSFSNP